jgi:glycosyltransferase involved in cell wall biosynthesis
MRTNAGKKILQIQLRYTVTASDLAEQIIAGLPADHYEVTTLFLRGRPNAGEPASTAARSVYFDLEAAELKGLKRLFMLRRLYRFCRQEGFDAVIAHRFKPISMMMWIGLWLKHTAFVGVQHGIGDYDRNMRRWEARLLMSSRWRIVGVSRAVTSYLINTVGAFNSDNTLTINNAIDIERARKMMLSAADARAYLGLPMYKRIVGCIGRLVPVKGHILLVEAFSKIAKQYPNALVAIIGEGRSRAQLEAAISQHDLQQQVLLLGAHEDALQYVRAFDVFAMPSFSEGLPLALLEALAGERPVIGSDIPSMLSILQDCNGSTFRTGDADDLAEKLSYLLGLEPAQLQKQGRFSCDYLYKNHAIEDFRQSYRDLIKMLLSAHR